MHTHSRTYVHTHTLTACNQTNKNVDDESACVGTHMGGRCLSNQTLLAKWQNTRCARFDSQRRTWCTGVVRVLAGVLWSDRTQYLGARLQDTAGLTSLAVFTSTADHYQTLPGRRSSNWPTVARGPATFRAYCKSATDAFPRYSAGQCHLLPEECLPSLTFVCHVQNEKFVKKVLGSIDRTISSRRTWRILNLFFDCAIFIRMSQRLATGYLHLAICHVYSFFSSGYI